MIKNLLKTKGSLSRLAALREQGMFLGLQRECPTKSFLISLLWIRLLKASTLFLRVLSENIDTSLSLHLSFIFLSYCAKSLIEAQKRIKSLVIPKLKISTKSIEFNDLVETRERSGSLQLQFPRTWKIIPEISPTGVGKSMSPKKSLIKVINCK